MASKYKYEDFSDEKLVELYKGGSSEAMDCLLERYKSMVRKKARTLYLVGGDQDDLIQEGTIELFKAVVNYNPDKQASFRTFASMCIDSRFKSVIRASDRQKNRPLNDYVAFDEPFGQEGDTGEYVKTLSDILSSVEFNPENIILSQEQNELLRGKLSDFERQVLDYYLEGLSYFEIGTIMGKPGKSVDNAIQRIRNKLKDEN